MGRGWQQLLYGVTYNHYVVLCIVVYAVPLVRTSIQYFLYIVDGGDQGLWAGMALGIIVID